MKKLCLFFVLAIFFIQFSFLPSFKWGMEIPNLLLITATIIGVRSSSIENFFCFFLTGFLFDIFSNEAFGFNLIVFLLAGSLIWFLKNIILNKERNIFLEIFFWFLVKIIWDFIYKAVSFFWSFFTGIEEKIKLFDISLEYFKETLAFIFIGILIAFIWEFLRNFRKK